VSTAASLAAAAETDVLLALAAGRTVEVEVGFVWAGGMQLADEGAALNLIARGQARMVGTHLQLTADGERAVPHTTGGAA
jgi:hypothetical protein